MVTRNKQQRVKVRQLTQHGVNTDIEPFELPLNAFTNAINIAFRGGRASKAKGYSEIMNPSPDEVVKMYNKNGYIYYGTSTGIYQFNGKTHNDLSKGGNRIELKVKTEGQGIDYSVHVKSGAVEQTFTYTSTTNPHAISTLEDEARVSQYGFRWETKLPEFVINNQSSQILRVKAVSNEPTHSIFYTWYKDGVDMGSYNSSIVIPSSTETHVYKCVAILRDEYDELEQISTETILELPLEFSKELPEEMTTPYDSTFTLAVATTGSSFIEYQWYKDDVLIPNETNKSLIVQNIKDGGVFKVVAKSHSGEISDEILVKLPLKWALELPKFEDVTYDDNKTYRVLATGSDDIAYKWFKNEVVIDGETNDNITFNNIQESFELKVEASADEYVITSKMSIEVDDGGELVITKELESHYEVKEGASQLLEVTAKGTEGTIRYKWFSKLLNADWVEIVGATEETYEITKLAASADYKVEVSYGVKTRTSSTIVEMIPWVADTKKEVLEGLMDKMLGYNSIMRALLNVEVNSPVGGDPIMVVTRNSADDVFATNPVNLDMKSADANRYTPFTQWYADELSNVIVFSNIGNVPQYKGPQSYGFLDLPNWDKTWRTPRIRSYKNFLLAMSTLENGIEYNQRIRWSDIAYPNEPPHSWDATSTINSAGFNDLSEAKGKIVDGLPMGDSFVIYTDEEVFLMDYVAGSNIFRFRKADFAVSILAPECAVYANGGHVVMTKDDIVFHKGVSPVSLADSKIREYLFENIGSLNYENVKMLYLAPHNEVWICYAKQDSANTRAKTEVAVYNMSNQTWSFRTIAPSLDINFGVAPVVGDDIINDQDIIIDKDNRIIDGIGKDFRDATLIASTIDKKFMVMDNGSTADGKPLIAYLEKRYIDFDAVGMDSDSMKFVTGIHPQISGSGKVYIKIGSSDTPQSSVSWSNPVLFDIQNDYKADFTVNGRYISVRFEVLDNSNMELTGYDVVVSNRTRR